MNDKQNVAQITAKKMKHKKTYTIYEEERQKDTDEFQRESPPLLGEGLIIVPISRDQYSQHCPYDSVEQVQ